MTLYEFEGRRPVIGEGSLIYETADIIGEVVIGRDTYVGPGAVLRADEGRIEIGNGCSIQDHAVIHTHDGMVTRIADNVTLGHGCVVQNCTIFNHAVIGMKAVVSEGARIGEWAVVGEMAVVTKHKVVEPGRIVLGIPARAHAVVSEEYRKKLKGSQGVSKYGDNFKIVKIDD